MHSPEHTYFLVELPIQTNRNSHEEIANRLADTQGVQQALKRAASETIREHAMSGQKIVVWRDNQIVWEEVSLASIPDRTIMNNRNTSNVGPTDA